MSKKLDRSPVGVNLIYRLLFCFCLVGCFASNSEESVDSKNELAVSENKTDVDHVSSDKIGKISVSSILPESFSSNSSREKTYEYLVFPVEFFNESEIIRPRAELRMGPGIQFPLKEDVLSKGTKVLVFERIGVWQKVLAYEAKGEKIFGWTHYQTLKESYKSQLEMTISVRDLPNLVALHKITKIYTNPEFELKKVDIPRGRVFNWLCRRNKKYLVWIAETNSVAWFLEEDVR